MAVQPPTAAEFAEWLTPAEALARFHPGRDEAERKRGIIRRLGNGQLRAAGYGEGGLVCILAARWRDWNISDGSLWTIGDVSFSRGGRPFDAPILFVEGREYNPPPPLEAVSFVGVRLDPTRLADGFEEGQALTAASDQAGGKIAAAEIERFARLYLDIWGAAATEMKALAAIRCCYPEASIGRDTFLAKFRELRGPGKVGKPSKNKR
jgi:hypothetical protein